MAGLVSGRDSACIYDTISASTASVCRFRTYNTYPPAPKIKRITNMMMNTPQPEMAIAYDLPHEALKGESRSCGRCRDTSSSR